MAKLSQREQQVWDAFEQTGNACAAARELGISRSSVRTHLKRAQEKTGRRPKSMPQENQNEHLKAENKSLREQLKLTADALADARHAGPVPETPTAAPAVKAEHVRVFIGDLHAYHQDAPAVEAFMADMKVLQPAEICLLGDMIDCSGFLAQHHTMGFVAETPYTFEQDVKALNTFLTRLQVTCPNTRIRFIEGNHEHRIEQWCVTQTLKNETDARFLFEHFNPRSLCRLDARGIEYISKGSFVDDVSIRGTIRYEVNGVNMFATHGITACKHAAARHVERFGGNVVYGHTHRDDSYMINTVTNSFIGGWSPGCLCKRVRLWNHNQPDNWTTGYHLQLVSKSGLFQPLNVKLIKGQSLLSPLLETS